MRLNKGPLAALAIAATLAATAGCGSSSSDATRADARTYAFASLRARSEGVDRAPAAYRGIDELLGNVSFRVDGGRPKPVTDLVVVGAVTKVQPGFGFVPATATSSSSGTVVGDGVKVDFDDPAALWRTEHLTVRVDEVLSGNARPGQVIKVGQVINGPAETDAAKFSHGVVDMGRAVWFLSNFSPVFAYDKSLFSDVKDGGLIAPISDDGRLTLPFDSSPETADLLASAPTLTALRDAAKSPGQVIEVSIEGGIPRRQSKG